MTALNIITLIASGISMPLIATIYSIIRKPEWYQDMKHPNWITMNIISMLFGFAFGLFAALYEIITSLHGAASIPIGSQAYIAQVFGTVGWSTYHFTVSDWKTTKINRHTLRLMLIIQLITSIIYCFTIPGTSRWVFALITTLLTLVSLIVPIIAWPKKDKKTHKPIIKNGKKVYTKLIPMGMSDARGLALMMAACFPLLTSTFIFPILGFLLIGFMLTVYFFTYSGITGTKTNDNGSVELIESKTEGAKRILANKTDSIRKQSIPLGPAIAIPFAIAMIVWLFF